LQRPRSGHILGQNDQVVFAESGKILAMWRIRSKPAWTPIALPDDRIRPMARQYPSSLIDHFLAA
jgi:hypothetical protein